MGIWVLRYLVYSKGRFLADTIKSNRSKQYNCHFLCGHQILIPFENYNRMQSITLKHVRYTLLKKLPTRRDPVQA